MDDVPIAVLVVVGVLVLVPVALLGRLPCDVPAAAYATPLMPYLPLFGIFCNIYLICSNQVLSLPVPFIAVIFASS